MLPISQGNILFQSFPVSYVWNDGYLDHQSEAADGKYEAFNEANSPQFLLQVVEVSPWLNTILWMACLVCTSSTHCQSSAMELQISRIPFMDHTHLRHHSLIPSFNMLTTRLSQPCSPWSGPSLPSQCHLLSIGTDIFQANSFRPWLPALTASHM
jgi:hypothetical protein